MGCVLLCAVLHSASLILLKCCSAPLWSHNRAVKLRRAGTVAGRKLRAILYIKIKKYNKIKHLQKCYLFTLHKSDQTHQETGGYTVADAGLLWRVVSNVTCQPQILDPSIFDTFTQILNPTHTQCTTDTLTQLCMHTHIYMYGISHRAQPWTRVNQMYQGALFSETSWLTSFHFLSWYFRKSASCTKCIHTVITWPSR